MNKLICLSWIIISIQVFPQASFIQSIDFDSQGRAVYALSGDYDSSYVIRRTGESEEIWNLTELYNLEFDYICSTVDDNDNIWAYMGSFLYHFDGTGWSRLPVPEIKSLKWCQISYHNNYLWLSHYTRGSYFKIGVLRFNIVDSTWTDFDKFYSEFPAYSQTGKFFHSGDSTWLGTTKGLILFYKDSIKSVIDNFNQFLSSAGIYTFFIDSKNQKWLGTMMNGLVEWINDSTFVSYNSDNSSLPNNFINSIDEDSEGTLWLATDAGFASFKNDSITPYSHLVNRTIPELIVDENDKIWFSTVGDKGLYVFDGTNFDIISDVENINTPVVESFNLYQNYPNPFNPTTKIKFTIPSTNNEIVTLKVFDILGNEIATLVNEEKPAGEYEVEFNAGKYNLSSGVYYYILRLEGFIQINNMVYLK